MHAAAPARPARRRRRAAVAAATQELAADREHQAELAEWVGQPGETGLGVPWSAVGPRPDHEPGPVRDLGTAPGSPRQSASFELEPQLGVLSTARDRKEDWLRAGQGLQRVLLTATRFGVSTSLLYQPIELHDMSASQDWWPWPEHPQIIIRFGYGPSSGGAPRRPLADALDRG